jgi:hypothetical protein
MRGRARERVLVLRGGVGDHAVPELHVQVLFQRVVEGVREPRGGLLGSEAAGAWAVAIGGRDRPVVRLGLLRRSHCATTAPRGRRPGAIGGSTHNQPMDMKGDFFFGWG